MPDLASRPQPGLEFLGAARPIAIRHRPAPAGRPTILFLPGYASDMEGQKAVAIDAFCAASALGCLRLDYSGTGSSPGAFAKGTLDLWLEDVLAALDSAAPHGPIILAGSSMGAWIALHVALRRSARIAALLGIAAAPDFTDWGFGPEERRAVIRDGRIVRGGSLTTLAFWRSGAAFALLKAPIDLHLPVRLVHGMRDEAVPVAIVLQLAEQLGSTNVQLRLLKDSGHRLSAPHEIDAILGELAALVDRKESQ